MAFRPPPGLLAAFNQTRAICDPVTKAGTPERQACYADVLRKLAVGQPAEQIAASMTEAKGRNWLLWGAAGAIVLVAGALLLTRKG